MTDSGFRKHDDGSVGLLPQESAAMRGAAIYGACIGIACVVLGDKTPQPAGSVILWTFFAAQLTWAAILCQRRTGLAVMTAALATNAAGCLLIVILALNGHIYPDMPIWAWVMFGVTLLISGGSAVFQTRASAAKWKTWRDYANDKTAWDIVRGRHIPDLRATARDEVAGDACEGGS